MKVIIRKAKIVDPFSPYHLHTKDVLIEKGVFKQIEDHIEGDFNQEITGKNIYLSQGFCDLRTFSKEPGLESMEDLNSLSLAAAKGGFTHLAIMPNTTPVISTKESLGFFKNFSKNKLTQLHPVAAVTKDCKGEDFTEMWDLHTHGAIAFSDGSHSLWNADIFLKTLQYLSPKGALLINKAEEPTLAMFGQINEGKMSVRIGLKGIPSTAEEIMIQRDLKLLEYADLNNEKPALHFSAVSTSEGLSLIRKAKAKGLAVSCDVTVNHLFFTEDDLYTFDTNLKLSPPLRTKRDKKAILRALEDGTIDAIVSDHNPLDEEHKKCEFDLASFGAIGLQTAFAAAFTGTSLNPELILQKMSIEPKKLLGLEMNPIIENSDANLAIIDMDEEFTFQEKDIVSLSKNSPFVGKTLKGKVLGSFANNQFIKN